MWRSAKSAASAPSFARTSPLPFRNDLILAPDFDFGRENLPLRGKRTTNGPFEGQGSAFSSGGLSARKLRYKSRSYRIFRPPDKKKGTLSKAA